jgi:hypothetical protein
MIGYFREAEFLTVADIKHMIFCGRVAQIFQKSRSHLKILDVRMVT